MKLGTLALALLANTTVGAQAPNILLVIADDLGLDPVPGYLQGPEKAAMPHLEGLMAQGLTFDNVWADPLCSPTRSTILTGRYGFRTGVLSPGDQSLLPSNELTLHQYLADIGSGYASSIIGKWHLGGLQPDPSYPNTLGVPYYAGLLSGAVSSYDQWPLTINGSTTPSTTYITTAITDLAIDWITEQTTPWFCWVAYTAPHSPFHLPPLDMHAHDALPGDQASIDADPLPYFLAMCESVDHEVGRLMTALPPDELANTVVIFIGDNGTEGEVIQAPYIPAHAKGTLFEGGVHVPLVVAGPGITRAGEREPALVNTTDLFATMVELTGHALPSYEDSRSLLPLFTQAGASVRTCLYTEVDDAQSGSAVRDDHWKLITFTSGQQRFYDLENDPWESTNLLIGGLNGEEQLAFDALQTSCSVATSATGPVPTPGLAIRYDPNTSLVHITGGDRSVMDVLVADAMGRIVGQFHTWDTFSAAGLPDGVLFVRIDQGERQHLLSLVKM